MKKASLYPWKTKKGDLKKETFFLIDGACVTQLEKENSSLRKSLRKGCSFKKVGAESLHLSIRGWTHHGYVGRRSGSTRRKVDQQKANEIESLSGPEENMYAFIFSIHYHIYISL